MMNQSSSQALAQSGVFCSRLITTSTAVEFSEMYNSSSFVNVIECPSPSLGPDELLILFNSVCSDILDVWPHIRLGNLNLIQLHGLITILVL